MKKWSCGVCSLLIAFVILFSINSKDAAAATLRDIPSNSSAEINYLISKGIIQGYPGDLFMPDKTITREEAAAIIGRAKNLNGTKRATSFPDVSANSYASGYIQSAVEKRYITGYSNGTFGPNDLMTRGQMAFLLQRAFELTQARNITFSDVPVSNSEYYAVDRIATAGLTNGYPDGTFRPNENMTREQFALFVARGLHADFRVSYIGVPIKEAFVNVDSGDVLNVRSGPSTDHSIVGRLNSGTKVQIYRNAGDWAYISSGSISGYVSNNYLSSIDKKRIAIDPGHGGSDPGAIGIGGLVEKELNLSVALKVESLLKSKGIEVVMTRRDDTYPTLTERINIAVNANADAFVSIHGNSSVYESANGTETYYSTASVRADDSQQMATFIQNRLYPALGTRDRGVKTANYQVISNTPLPSVLVELGFISNNSDASKLASDAYRNKAAEAIASGIQDYYNWKQ